MLRPVFASSPLFRTSALTALALAANLASAQDVQTVKIAHAGPVSGGIAHIGKDVENGVRLALDEINAEHPVIGGKPVQFKLMAEDDAGDGDDHRLREVADHVEDAAVPGGGRHADLPGDLAHLCVQGIKHPGQV